MKSIYIISFIVQVIVSSSLPDKDEGTDSSVVDKRLTTLEADISEMKTQMERLLGEISQIHEAVLMSDPRKKRDIPGGTAGQDTIPLGNKGSQQLPTPNNNADACTAGSLNCPYAMSSDCVVCPSGPQGTQGVTGPTGLPGRDGRDGRDGSPGFKGDTGDMANMIGGMSQTKQDQSTQLNIADFIRQQNTSGVTYVRWGRTICPDAAEIVYHGYIAGGHRDLKGGGGNYLCLPEVPIYSSPNAGFDSSSRIYGTEYEVDDFPKLNEQGIDDTEALCAVCLAPLRNAVVVVPGRNECLSETSRKWNLEYNGYLMASSYRYQRSEYVCVDGHPEYKPGSHSNENDSTMYVVESRCSSTPTDGLPCPPYVDGYEMTCAVCTS